MKGKINFDCYKNSGGTDKITAINYSGVKLNKYDKVIISEGETKESDFTAFNISNSYSSRALADQTWARKNTIYSVQRISSSSAPFEIYKRYDKKWFRYNTSSNKDYDQGASFHYTNDGKIIYYSYEYNHNTMIINNDFSTTVPPTYCIYLGQHNNKGYVIQKSTGNIYEYDLETNAWTSGVLYTTGKIQFASMRDDKIIVTSATTIFILSFDTDDSIYLENSISSTNIYSKFITGAKYNDYLFTSTMVGNQAINNSAYIGNLRCFKLIKNALDDTYTYIEETPKILEKFTTQPCTMNYNPFCGFLTIGTMDNVYLYKFNHQTKEFIEIPLTDVLPEKLETSLYKGCASPDGSEILVTSYTTSTASSKISLTGYKEIVALCDNIENIEAHTYNATITEDALPYERVEANTIVPYTATITFNVSPSANNLILTEGEN